jgi:hypothetical protein
MSIKLALPQVTRIPITGPAPFNTLVCVQSTSNGGPQDVKKNRTSRWAVTVPTTFRLAGFDQRVVPVFDHSTTAFISSLGPLEDSTWLYAVDEVTGAGFDQVDGSYFVNINVAVLAGDAASEDCIGFGDPQDGTYVQICSYFYTIQVVSFILCNEPRLPDSQIPFGHRSTVYVEKVPLHRAASLLEQAATQLGKPYALNPRREATSTTLLDGCDCKKK